ncbi:hypothetical protein PanWU01x14_366750 [Parasponia andersonii]|uniref:Transmembrane protein n=1 Tax=Parasponia andersonii TaxID=3476 RepID=A0A2P5A5H8_PARAD|nr:hypothetical protein PanWU01x14_366750 [Parasponia andersonii]
MLIPKFHMLCQNSSSEVSSAWLNDALAKEYGNKSIIERSHWRPMYIVGVILLLDVSIVLFYQDSMSTAMENRAFISGFGNRLPRPRFLTQNLSFESFRTTKVN